MEDVKVITVKGFLNGGQYVRRGQIITVPELRARELEGNGLVARETKKAPDAANKMAKEPQNKAKAAK
ncbi:hypothetical protein CAL14_05550 [Bordetella genomosp. 9]|uniref:hypothetical protein n=1 Tax=Bordetella genomosp. 9 TaxID=1416803 RepID=UPI000A28D6EE|nr:hypothetical protein [Bordetella genomosp. 9]ARP89819.1 hypothetical protein CAL14_05550 [Bordetella genomosp. 9]